MNIINHDRISAKNKTLVLIFATIIMTSISWFRAILSRTLKVDQHGLSGVPEIFAVLTFLFALALFSYFYYLLWKSDELEIPGMVRLARVLAIIFSCMVPLLSNDIFSYFAFADASNKGLDVYTQLHTIQASYFSQYVGPLWQDSPCAYGPVSLALSKLAVWPGHENIVAVLVIYKTMMLLCAFLFIEASVRICHLLQAPRSNLLFIVLNPILLLQGVGQLHADIIAITFIIWGIYFSLTRFWYITYVLLALCIATKMNYVVLVPFFLILSILRQKDFIRKAAIGLSLFLITLSLAYFPFYTSMETISFPFHYHYHQNPSHVIAEVTGYLFYSSIQLAHAKVPDINAGIHAITAAPELLSFWNISVRICQFIAIITSAILIVSFWCSNRNVSQWYRVFVRCLLLFLLFYVHILNSWHLMMFLPFLWMKEDQSFMKWLFWLTCFVNVQNLVCMVTFNSVTHYLVLLLTTTSIMVYAWNFRKSFLYLPNPI